MTGLSVAATSAAETTRATVRQLVGGGPRRIAESAGIVISHGEGAWLYDDDGNAYLDFATAMGVAAIGHAHPHWSQAIAHQATRLAASVLHTHEHADYLAHLRDYIPAAMQQIALYSGGSEAVEVAVRLAQSYTGKQRIISFTNGFHGKTAGVRFAGHRYPEERSALGIDWIEAIPYPVCVDHDAVDYVTCEETGEGSITALEAYAAHLDSVAAIIVEPVLGTAGNRPPERGFLRALRDVCTRHGWLLILDESITGFGRLGAHFAADYFDVTPDILVLGKAIGGGYPLSGVAAPTHLWNGSLYAELSSTSSSYGANPIACAAGSAVLDIVTAAGFADTIDEVSRQLADGIRGIEAASPYVKRSRGVGMMLGFDFIDPKTGDPASAELCLHLFRNCLAQGILIVGDVPGVRLNPPLTLTPSEASVAIESLGKALCP